MPHGGPDWGEVGLPDYAAGQLPWFQSQAEDVGIGADKDFLNYVVPDAYELHVCSGIISCEAPRTQKFKFITIPAGTWVSPTSHSDPDDEWTDEENAYDGDIATRAWDIIDGAAWGSDIILLVNQASIDKVRFYAYYEATSINKIYVDVWYEGNWHNIYDGAFADHEWVEAGIPAPARLVSKALVRFYNGNPWREGASLYEFMFNTVGETAQETVYFDTYAIIPYHAAAPYPVPAGAKFIVRVHNDDDAIQRFSVNLAGFLQAKA